MKQIEIGSFVKSRQGRDINKIYIVKEVLGNSVKLINGNGRSIEKPKTKNIKHIEVLGGKADKIAEKLSTNKKIFEEEIYSAIKEYK